MIEPCTTCHFHVAYGDPKNKNFRCQRFPSPVQVVVGYGCGEHKLAEVPQADVPAKIEAVPSAVKRKPDRR